MAVLAAAVLGLLADRTSIETVHRVCASGTAKWSASTPTPFGQRLAVRLVEGLSIWNVCAPRAHPEEPKKSLMQLESRTTRHMLHGRTVLLRRFAVLIA
jgi:hypothetical protein